MDRQLTARDFATEERENKIRDIHKRLDIILSEI